MSMQLTMYSELYTFTNESLDEIVEGLSVDRKDSVLTVGGCGDQAFALLEYAGKVIIVDISSTQIDFIRARVKSLREGDYTRFLNPLGDGRLYGAIVEGLRWSYESDLKQREGYFEKGRLKIIRRKLTKLEIRDPDDILRIAQTEQGFNKIYLSNALSYAGGDTNVRYQLEQIARNLQPGNLIYVADHDKLMIDLPQGFLPGELIVDTDLTRSIRNKLNNDVWTPAVYRRI